MAHTPEVWNLSRDHGRASSDTGSAPLPPSGEEIFGVKVFAFPLNSPKMGGRRGNRWYHEKVLDELYKRSKFRGDRPKKVGPKVVFNIEPHRLRPGVSYGPEKNKSESIPTLLHCVVVVEGGNAYMLRARRARMARRARSASGASAERGERAEPSAEREARRGERIAREKRS